MEGLFGEHLPLKNAYRGDLDGAETARIHMKDLHKLSMIIDCVTLAQDVVVTLRQHDAASAGNSKDLVSVNDSFVRLDGATEGVRKEKTDAATITFDELNGSAGCAIVEILGEDLDVDGGFEYVSIQLVASAPRTGTVMATSVMPRLKPAYLIGL